MLSETATTTVSPTTTVDVKPKTDAIANVPSREDIISDVDSIMTQLDQLSAQVKEDFNIEILDESLVLEGAWDDTKDNFGSLFGDPVFQLVGLGIAGIIGALGLSVKAVKDTKRNGAIGKMVMGDYAKLKQLKLQEVKLEAIQHQLEEKKDDIEAANESIIDEANPAAKKPAQKPAQKPQAGPNAQARQTAIADKEKALKAKEAEAKKNAAAANKTTSSDENDARDKMAEKIEAQIQAIIKKRDVLDTSITTYESTLDAKYAEEKITGFGSKKVHTLIASAKDGVAQEVAEARLKFFSETLSDEALKELKESLDAINQRQAKRTADINKEAEENAAKAKEVAAEDEDVKAALDKIKNPNADDEEEPETEEEPTADDGGGDSDAVKALKKQKEEDDEKKRQERAANKEDDTKNAEKETTKNTKDGKLDRVEDMIKKETEKVQNNPEAKKIKDKIAELEGAIEELKNKEKKSKEDDDKIAMIQKGVEAQKKQLDKVSSSDKLQKLKDLKDQIAAKENWQLEGTELGRLFEMEISKLEKEYMINESSSLSISNKFKLLMG
jgi:DNA repair exonuclease SbcCD ATPase subunit